MTPQRIFCLLSMAGACLLLSSCGGSENPLSDPLKAKPDARLEGIWRMNDDGPVEYYHVGRAGGKLPPGVMRAVWIVHNRDGTITRPHEWLVFSTIIGKKHYLNVVTTKDQGKDMPQLEEEGWKPDLIRGFSLMKYEVKGDTLNIWVMDTDAQRRLIQSGKIKGTIGKDGVVMFTDSTENLAALMASPESEDLFDKEPDLRYERVK